MPQTIARQLFREFMIPLILMVLAGFAGKISYEMAEMRSQVVDIRISLATISAKILEHERRITTIEHK